jgi:hypothetical protein
LLSKFFRVYPGFLVDDPDGYSPSLQSDLRTTDAKIDRWLYAGIERFPSDPELGDALLKIAEVPDSRHALLLLAEILRAPGLAERLSEVLKPADTSEPVAPPQATALQSSGQPPPTHLQA